MDSEIIQKDPTASTENTAEPDLDWLSLDEGEEILWASTPHKMSMLPWFISGIVTLIFLIGLVLIPIAYLSYTNTAYVVTNKGVYSKKGIISQNVKQVELNKIQNTSYSQTAIGGSLGYGKVEISTAGGSGVEMRFLSIPNPKEVRRLISSLTEQEKESSKQQSGQKEEVLEDILTELREIKLHLSKDVIENTRQAETTQKHEEQETHSQQETSDSNRNRTTEELFGDE